MRSVSLSEVAGRINTHTECRLWPCQGVFSSLSHNSTVSSEIVLGVVGGVEGVRRGKKKRKKKYFKVNRISDSAQSTYSLIISSQLLLKGESKVRKIIKENNVISNDNRLNSLRKCYVSNQRA